MKLSIISAVYKESLTKPGGSGLCLSGGGKGTLKLQLRKISCTFTVGDFQRTPPPSCFSNYKKKQATQQLVQMQKTTHMLRL